MSYADWREEYDQHADVERAQLDKVPIHDLYARVQARDLGDCYQIWGTIAARANLTEVGWMLFDVLESDLDYLHRYHCADALLHLLGEKQLTAVDLSAEWGRTKNLPTVAALLDQRIGPRR